MNLTPSDWVSLASGFGGALIGAIVGGAISLLLARQASAETLRRDEAERIAVEKLAAFRTMLKVQQISNGIHTTVNFIRDSIGKAHELGLSNKQMWEMVTPVVGLSNPSPTFEASDFTPFVSAGRADIIDRVNMLSARFDSMESSFRRYSERHLELQDFLSPFTTTVAETGISEAVIPPTHKGSTQVRAKQLNDLIRQVYQYGEADLKEAGLLCDELGKIARSHFKDPNFFALRTAAAQGRPEA